MVYLVQVVVLLVLQFPSVWAGPIIIGNGGDSVVCRQAQDNEFEGYYALDYLLTYSQSQGHSDVARVNNWEESYQRLSKLLRLGHGDLSFAFENFVQHLDNGFDYTRPRLWKEAAFGLVDIKDERIIRRLPENCRSYLTDETLNLVQTVIRVERANMVLYEYDPEILATLKQDAPLQYSFLLVHEWLWDFTQDVRAIRDLNRFLHSKRAESLIPEAFKQAIVNMGVDLRPASFTNVCLRTTAIHDQIVHQVGKPCDEITSKDVLRTADNRDRAVESLVIVDGNHPFFKIGDFAGLSSLRQVIIRNSGTEHLYSNAFIGLTKLERVDFSHNRLRSLPDSLFREVHRNYRRFTSLDFSHNQLEHIPYELFTLPVGLGETSASIQLLLNDNRITELPEMHDEMPLRYFEKIDLRNNQLTEFPEYICRLGQRGRVDLRGNPLSESARTLASQEQCRGLRI